MQKAPILSHDVYMQEKLQVYSVVGPVFPGAINL